MENRFNIYDLPHKALRNILGELNLQFGKTDYNNEKQLKALKDKLLKLMALLASHAHIEDSLIINPLEKKGVTGLETDKKEHNRLDQLIFKLSSGMLQLRSQDDQAQSRGQDLYLLFNQFNGEYLLHMYREETETLPIVFEHFSDEDLLAVRDYILEKTPPKILLDWYWYCLPAQTHNQRVAALRPILEKPKETLQATLRVVKAVLIEKEFEQVLDDLGLKIV